MLTAEQIRGARAALRWEQSQLAERASVSVETVKRLEKMNGRLRAQYGTQASIRDAFENAGVVFLDDDSAGGFGFLLSIDRKKVIREKISREVQNIVSASLESEEKRDPLIYERGADYVAEKICKMMPNLLNLVMRRVLPSHQNGPKI
jgi:transcriptional regulator with XRE-family HTH domain